MKKTLVLINATDTYYFNHIQHPDIDLCGVFRTAKGEDNFLLKTLRKLKCSGTRFFYLDWYKNIKKYERIVVLDMALNLDLRLLENITKKNSKCEKYLYSWNIIKNEKYYQVQRRAAEKAKFEFYCYDYGDCAKYGLKFNTIMYDCTLTIKKEEKISDTLFLGFMKDRKEKMLKLYTALNEVNLIPRFVIVGTEENKDLPFEFSKSYIGYYDYLKMLSKSKSILDIAQSGQTGYSMRVMEAIFFNKKLITTNKAVRDAFFYDPSKILIIDLENINSQELATFFNKEYLPYTQETREYYSFEKWLERFSR